MLPTSLTGSRSVEENVRAIEHVVRAIETDPRTIQLVAEAGFT